MKKISIIGAGRVGGQSGWDRREGGWDGDWWNPWAEGTWMGHRVARIRKYNDDSPNEMG
jgi:hypothetical protein